jgi:Skp family chaperone for outer membrane proteins
MMMHRMTIQSKVFGGLLVAVLLTGVAYQAGAQRSTRAEPTAVATVNLSLVLEGLEERASAERVIESLRAEFEAQDKQKQADIEQLEQTLADIVDDEARRKKRDDIDLKTLEFLAWRRVKSEQMDLERTLLLQDLYKKISAAIQEQAVANGYELVLVDDSSSDFTYNPELRLSREMQVRQQIVSRRMMWGSDRIDMTEDLIVRMNNAYQSGAGMATGTGGQTP